MMKSNWQAAHEEWMAEERRRLGDPPAFEKVSAFLRGELSAIEEEQVRAQLACHPELARALVEPFPDEDPAAERALVSDAELSERWAAIERRIDGPRVGVLRFPHAVSALAASLMLVFAGLYWSVAVRVAQPEIVSAEFTELRPGATRGAGRNPMPLTANHGEYQIAVPLVTVDGLTNFRVRIEDAHGERLWQSEVVESPESAIAVKIPASFLDPGVYDVQLIGVDGANEEELIAYPVKVSERRSGAGSR
jgi:hypothetical protein